MFKPGENSSACEAPEGLLITGGTSGTGKIIWDTGNNRLDLGSNPVKTTGIIYADGGVDRATAATLSIGVTNANAITIGKTGITTSIPGTLTPGTISGTIAGTPTWSGAQTLNTTSVHNGGLRITQSGTASFGALQNNATFSMDGTTADRLNLYLWGNDPAASQDKGEFLIGGLNSGGGSADTYALFTSSAITLSKQTTIGPASGLTDPHVFQAGGSSSVGGDDPEAGVALFTDYLSGGSGIFNIAQFHLDRSTVGDGAGITFALDDAGGSRRTYGLIGAKIADNTDASLDGTLTFQQMIANTLTEVIKAEAGAVTLGPSGFTGTHTVNARTVDFVGTTWQDIVLKYTTAAKISSAKTSGTASDWELGHITGTGRLQARSGGSGGAEIIAGATSWTSMSDMRYKTKVSDLGPVLDGIKGLSVFTYRLNENITAGNDIVELGMSAQEMLTVAPEIVNGTEDTQYSLSYDRLGVVLVKAIQELSSQVDDLKAELAALKGAQ